MEPVEPVYTNIYQSNTYRKELKVLLSVFVAYPTIPRKRQRQTDRDRDTETQRQRQRRRETERDRDRERQRDRETERQREKQGRGNDSCHFSNQNFLPCYLCKYPNIFYQNKNGIFQHKNLPINSRNLVRMGWVR